ncbi:MAG: amino acid aminotransferase [Sphingobium sp.]
MKTFAYWSRLDEQPADGLLKLIGMFAADPRDDKIDLGVGVYKDEGGATPVFESVKSAERQLVESQPTKSYVGPEGDIGFFRGLLPIIFGADAPTQRIVGLQTPGGTGALRLGFELLARANKEATWHVGAPTWANHPPIASAVGLKMASYPHIDLSTQALCIDEMKAALAAATPGDIVLLHGCCHNPTGADYSEAEWAMIAELCAERGLLPFIDLAYQGLGDGLEQDAAGVRIMARKCPELLVAYSCDKNFGLYRERVGALFLLAGDAENAALAQTNLLSLARANWSMPPDHGAAVARMILESDELTAVWKRELEGMRQRIVAMREGLAALEPSLAFMTRQKGMFSTLHLTPEQIVALREVHGVYMAGSGRINIAGLVPANLSQFVRALSAAS